MRDPAYRSTAATYRITYGSGMYPTSWTQLAVGNATITNNTMAAWTVPAENGIYAIRLTVYFDNDSTWVCKNVRVDHSLKTGWPQVIPSKYYYEPFIEPTLADLNHDGSKEIVVRGGIIGISAYNGKGNMLPGWPNNSSFSELISGLWTEPPSVSVADIDNDGAVEVVSFKDYGVLALTASNINKSGFPHSLYSVNVVGNAVPVLADLDNNGTMEIVAKPAYADPAQLIVLNSDGTDFKNWPYSFTGFTGKYYANNYFGAYDIDNDSYKEIVGIGPDNKLYVFSYDGTLRQGYPITLPLTEPLYSSPIIVDINNDNEYEIGFCTHTECDGGDFYYVTLTGSILPGWPFHFEKEIVTSSVSVADIDRDGELETAFGVGLSFSSPCVSNNYNVYIVKQDGLLVNGWPKVIDQHVFGQIAMANIDSDANLEIIANGRDGKIYAWTVNGSVVNGFPKSIIVPGFSEGFTVVSTPAIGDVDGDGLQELVVAASNTQVFVWELDGLATKVPLQWPMSNGGPTNNKDIREGKLLPDIIAPTTPTNLLLFMGGVTSTTASLRWKISTDNFKVIAYDIYNGGTLLTSIPGTALPGDYVDYILTNLTPNTIYSLTVKARDRVGNVSAPSNVLIVNTDITPPTAPSSFGVSRGGVGANYASLYWVGSTDNIAVVAYDVYNGTQLIATFATTAQGGTVYQTVSGLTPNIYSFTVKARDAAGNVSAPSNVFTINTNHTPVITAVGNKTVTEGSALSFTVVATDPDGQTLTYSTATALPAGATLNSTTGVFTWTPSFTQAGSYSITFRASDGISVVSTIAVITVINTNGPPVITAVGNKTVAEGSPLSFTVVATDPDGQAVTYSTSAPLPTGATLNSTTGAFAWTPLFTQAGSYSITFRASDGILVVSTIAVITVTNTNRTPVITAVGNKTVAEGSPLSFTVVATDPDGQAVTYSTSAALPAGATLNSTTGAFAWTPSYTQAGTYTIIFRASDGTMVGSNTAVITVTNTNRTPVITAVGNKTVAEGSPLSFTVVATDPDGQALTYSTSAALPTGATLNSTTGVFAWTPSFTQAGSYSITFSVSDGSLVVSNTAVITVTNTNRIPVITAVGNRTVAEGSALSFTVVATDPDGQALTYSTSAALPTGVTLNSTTGAFAWTPSFTQAGSYSITFSVSDGSLVVSNTAVITVTNTNRTPVITAVGNRTVAEGSVLSFTVVATDPDGQALIYSTLAALPAGATLNSTTGAFTWTPSFTQAGSYSITFRASDGTLVGSNIAVITVTNTNRTPVITAVGNRTVAEGSALSFTVVATDPDGQALTYSTAAALPAGVTLNSTTGAFAWTPSYTQAGSYSITFSASDGSLVASNTAVFTVTNTNGTPVITAVGNKTVAEGSALTFTIVATDPDGQALTYSTSAALPAGATLNSTTGVFAWTPSFTQAGTYTIIFRASDGSLVASNTAVITVTNVNRAPVITAIGNKTVAPGSPLTFTVIATDPDGQALTYSAAAALPAGATLNSTTGVFTWTPSSTQAGSYTITFRASDGSLITSSTAVVNVSFTIPGRIQAEDYNTGGEGIGTHDLTSGNTGAAYRADNVDIEASTDIGGGHLVGWTDAGEWLSYNVNVASSGLYSISARMASGVAGNKSFSVSIDGTTVGTFNFGDGSGWQTWKDVVVSNVNLSSGTHDLRINITAGQFNLNYLTITPVVTNVLTNGDFSADLTNWEALIMNGASASITNDAGHARFTINNHGANPFDIQINQNISLVANKTYTLEFDILASAVPKNFKVVVEHRGEPWTKYLDQQYTVTSPANTYQHFTITFTPTVNDAMVKLGFHLGTFNTSTT